MIIDVIARLTKSVEAILKERLLRPFGTRN